MSRAKSFWKTIPRTSFVGFLLGVFFIFSTMGLANDIMEMGRQPTLRFVLGVFLSGLFAMFYAFTGFVLRKQFWKALLPAFVVQFVGMYALGRLLPDQPRSIPMGAADIVRLESRLTLSAVGIMLAVGLGYGCFLYATITAGRIYSVNTRRSNWLARSTACWSLRLIRNWVVTNSTGGHCRAARSVAT